MEELKNFYKGKKINIFKNFNNLRSILPKKVDYAMSAISGIEGLLPTYKIIKHTKLIAIANKESIICGWNLIKKQLDKHKTKFKGVGQTLRIALVGSRFGPGLYDVILSLSKKEVIERLKKI